MNKVSVGLGTWLGLILTTAGASGSAWATAEGASSGISPGLLAVCTTVSGGLTIAGRMYQAAKMPTVIETVPTTPASAAESEPPATGTAV